MGDEKIRLQWTYEPRYFFEKKYESVYREAPIVIEPGKVVVEMDPKLYFGDTTRIELDKYITSMFEGVKLHSFEDYTLHKLTPQRILPSGEIVSIGGLRGTARITGRMEVKHADYVRYDDAGNVIEDTAQKRFDETIDLAELFAGIPYPNPLVENLMASWTNAIRNPDNEFLYLWEIWEALKDMHTFPKDKIDRFRNLVNGPYEQSRHRGEEWHSLKPATKGELEEARQIARGFIIAHLNTLVGKS